MNAVKTLPATWHSKSVARLTGATVALVMVAGCVTNEQGGPSNQAVGTLLAQVLAERLVAWPSVRRAASLAVP